MEALQGRNGKGDSIGNAMSFKFLKLLREQSRAWRLLTADTAPFVASFFYRVFVAENNRAVAETDLRIRLDSHIRSLNADGEGERFARPAKAYLDEWCDDAHGWLRKFYPTGKDEPHFDLTPQAQSALEWLVGQRPGSYISFIGTESRLITVFDILRRIVEGAETDPELRIGNLERRKAEIEREIERVRSGEVTVYDETQVRERFAQAITIAREIQSDFRAVEENFRKLDRSLREKISVWEKGKGELLEAIFEDREGIDSSEQGKSFKSFWQFLMSANLRDDFHENLNTVLGMSAVREMDLPQNVRDIEYDWIESGKHIMNTMSQLSAQLRRYVDENYLEEERRILRLVRGIERKALAVRSGPPKRWDMPIDALSPEIKLPFDRPLFAPRWKPTVEFSVIEEYFGDTPMDALFMQMYIKREKLEENILRALRSRDKVDLSEILPQHPIEQGLSELIAYVELSDKTVDEEDEIRSATANEAQDTAVYSWVDENGELKAARTEAITFRKKQFGKREGPGSAE
jgi:hypothetical protein